VGWLASRQTDKLLGEEDAEDDDDEAENDNEEESPTAGAEAGIGTESVEDLVRGLSNMTPLSGETISCAGFNGRCNKLADTCYSFWNGAALVVCLLVPVTKHQTHQVL
jgi:geranylgeranyl transferase type-1 subunit beta